VRALTWALFWAAIAGLVVSLGVHLWALLVDPVGALRDALWMHMLLLALAGATFLLYRRRGQSFEDFAPHTRGGRLFFATLFVYCLALGFLDDQRHRWRFHSSAWVLGYALVGFHLRRLTALSDQ
jgi:hypothetical protein